jgi:malonyl CoA-acyl carrier protein transacylase
VTSPVRFSDSLADMWSHGCRTFIHVGPGDVTAGMARKTLPDAGVLVVSTISDIGTAAEALVTVE